MFNSTGLLISVLALLFSANALAQAGQTVTTIISDEPDGSAPNQAYLVSVHVAGGDTSILDQRLDVEDDQGYNCVVTLNAQGTGSCELISRVAGARTLTARFNGTSTFLPSSDSESHLVSNQLAVSPSIADLDLRSIPGSPVISIQLSDGSLIIAGPFLNLGDLRRNGLARLLPGGTADPSFNVQVNGSVTSLARDAQDNIFFSGQFGAVNGSLRRNLAKVSADGLVDPLWVSARADLRVETVDLSGNLIATSTAASQNMGQFEKFSFKVSGATGALMEGFAPVFRGPDALIDIKITKDGGNLIAFGSFNSVNGVPRFNIARIFGNDGTLDINYAPNPNSSVRFVTSNGVGANYVGGGFTEIGGRSSVGFAKITGSGAQDAIFMPGNNGAVNSALFANDSLYVNGSFSFIGGGPQLRSGAARIDATTGALDSGFVFTPGSLLNATLLGADIWCQRFFLETGSSSPLSIGALRLNAITGTPLGTDFLTRPATIRATALEASGSMLVGGDIVLLGTSTRPLVRMQADGRVDESFAPNLGVNRSVASVTARPNGDIYVDDFSTDSFTSGVRKLSTTGIIDTNFGTNGFFRTSGSVTKMVQVNDGLIVGGFLQNNGSGPGGRVAKIDYQTGVATPMWDVSINGYIRDIVKDSSDNVYITGGFGTVNGQARANIAKIDAAGVLDQSWQVVANGEVTAAFVTPTSIYLGGRFTTINGVGRAGLAEVSATDGALTNWNPNQGRAAFVTTLARAPDGDILAGGEFLFIGGQYRSHLAKLNEETGLADAGWNPSLDGRVATLLVRDAAAGQGVDSVAVGGVFTMVGDVPAGGFAVLPLPARAVDDGIYCNGFEENPCFRGR